MWGLIILSLKRNKVKCLGAENEYTSKITEELRSINQFVELNKDFVLSEFIAYWEKVKGINILHLKLLNNQTKFKHHLKLNILTLDQYQKKMDILNGKLEEQELIKGSINDQFITNVFGGASKIALPAEDIISYLKQVFLQYSGPEPQHFKNCTQ